MLKRSLFIFLSISLLFTACAFKAPVETKASNEQSFNTQSNSERAHSESSIEIVSSKTQNEIQSLSEISTDFYKTKESLILSKKAIDESNSFQVRYNVTNLDKENIDIQLNAVRGKDLRKLNFKTLSVESNGSGKTIIISIKDFTTDMKLNSNNKATLEALFRTDEKVITIQTEIIYDAKLISKDTVPNNRSQFTNTTKLVPLKTIELTNPTTNSVQFKIKRKITGNLYRYIFEENNKYADCENARAFIPKKHDAVFWNIKDNLLYKVKEQGTIFIANDNEKNIVSLISKNTNEVDSLIVYLEPKQTIKLTLYFEKTSNNILDFTTGSCGVLRTKQNTANSCHIAEEGSRKFGCEQWEDEWSHMENCILGTQEKINFAIDHCYRCIGDKQRWKTSSWGEVTESAEVKGFGLEYQNQFNSIEGTNIEIDHTENTFVISGEIHPEWQEMTDYPVQCNLQKQ